MKKRIAIVASLFFCVSASPTYMDLVYVGDNTVTEAGEVLAQMGDVLAFEIHMNFGDVVTLGGSFGIQYSAGPLDFAAYAAADFGDPMFSNDPDLLYDGWLFGASVGAFEGLSNGLVATVSFVVTAAGPFTIWLENNSDPGPGWIDATDFVTSIPVNWGRVEGITTVPVPAGGWLFVSGLAALSGFRRS